MNEKLQYAEMLEIPVSTCNITYKPKKKRKFLKEKQEKPKNVENVKQELVDKINEEVEETVANEVIEEYHQYSDSNAENFSNIAQSSITRKPKKRASKLVVFELVLVGVLVATIGLTSAFIKDSAINVFFRNIFKSEAVVETDLRVYTDFVPNAPMTESDTITLTGGVMSLTKEGSVYSPCNGKITSITTGETGKYDIEIAHSDNFSTVFSGVDYVYGEIGDTVYSTIPLGYVDGLDAKVCFMSDTGLVTGYTILDGNVVWGA